MAPVQDSDGVACKVPIYSTSGPSDGSETERVVLDALRKCPHNREGVTGPETNPETAARLAAGKLADVARLAEAARALIAKESAEQQRDKALQEAVRRLDNDSSADVESLEHRLTEAEEAASLEEGRAYAAASRAGAADPWPPSEGAVELVEQAEVKLVEAGGLLAAAAGAEDAKTLGHERDRLARELTRLSTGLAPIR